MAGDKSRPASNCLWRDTAEGEDSLGFKPYVKAIAEFLTAEGTKPPITLSIEGQWGCGKSSFMKQLKDHIENLNKSENEISEEVGANGHIDIETNSEITGSGFWETLFPKKKYFTVLFNCWRYEKEDELWAAFALHFMDQLSEQLSWERRLWAQLKLRILRLKFKWKSKNSIIAHIVVFILAVWVFVDHSIPKFMEFLSSDSLDGSSGSVLITLTKFIAPVLPILYVGKDIIGVIGNPFNFSKFVSNPNYKEHISFIEHFHSDFGKIVESYVGDSRVYVFVDDLDRCEVPKAAELMQALNLMISDDANVYFSIGMDRRVISAGLAARNENILPYLEEVDGLKFGYDFTEKFIQLPFKVPSPTNDDFNKFLNLQQEQKSSSKASDIFGDSSSEFKAPDSGSQPDEERVKPESPESVKLEEEVPAESSTENSNDPKPVTNDDDCEDPGELDHILEMVVPALDRNPRRVKQFFNLFRFQRTLGSEIGLFSDRVGPKEYWWNCKKLAKFVAISIKWPSLIAALDSDPMLLWQLQDYAIRPEKEVADKEKLEKERKLTEKNEDEGKLEEKEKKELKEKMKLEVENEEEGKLEEKEKKEKEKEEKLEKWIKEKKKKEEEKKLEKWIKEKKLIELLREGCVEDGKLSEEYYNYTLSGIDLSKLLEISPEFTSSDSLSGIIKSIEFVWIPAGEFMMGSHEYKSEEPVRKVTIENPFDIGKYPVTQKQWIVVMGYNPSIFKGDDLPVESVSWYDVQDFIKKLNEMEGTDKYRLPSEAEWEYACRAGTNTKYSFGDDESKLGDYAWYSGYATSKEWNKNREKIRNEGSTHPVGQKTPNSWGLYDMYGNVWEWVQDRWHDNYKGAPSDGSAWEDGDGSDRVIRGGSWYAGGRDCRSADRVRNVSGDRLGSVGFRLLRKL